MSWAVNAIDCLKIGEAATLPVVNSRLMPILKQGETVLLRAVSTYCLGDYVLVTIKQRHHLGIISGFRPGQAQISDTTGLIGWATLSRVHGKVVQIF